VKNTVKEALQTKGLLRGKVIAGHGGLEREFTCITVSETPDSLDWLKCGELVCTTGYALIGNEELQSEWISGMARKNVAALIFKTERFFSSFPDHMIELADELNFPVIELPLDITWPVVIEGITALMISIQTRLLDASYSIYDQLTQFVLSARGLYFTVDAIAHMTQNPVFLEDRYLNPICHSSRQDGMDKYYSDFRLEQQARDELKGLMKVKDSAKSSPFTLPLKTEQGEIEQLIAPIFAGDHLFGYLTVLLANTESLDKELLDTIIVHGATALALELLINNTRFQLNTKEKTYLLKQLTNHTTLSVSEIKKMGGLFGVNFDLNTSVIILSCKPEVTYYSFDRLERYLLTIDPNAVLFLEKKNIVIFYHPKNIETLYKALEESKKIAEQMISHLEKEYYTVNAGIGNTYSQPEPMRKSYFEAKQCVKKAVAEKKRIICQDYRKMASLMSLVPNQEDLQTLAGNLLGNLEAYDREKNTELMKTLHSFFRHKCKQSDTAKALNIHVNTLSYRIARIQEILEADLDDMETCTMLFFSLKILES